MKDKIFKLLLFVISHTTIIIIVLISNSCKPKCAGTNPIKEVRILTSTKNAMVSFPEGTSWIFECDSTGEKDTIIISNKVNLPFLEGSCVDLRDCCTKYYYQEILQNFEIRSTSGLNHFSGYTLKGNGFYIETTYRAIPMDNGDIVYNSFPGYSFQSNITLAISGKH